MRNPNPLVPLAESLYSAINTDLSPVAYRSFAPNQKNKGMRPEDAPMNQRRPLEHECSVVMFPQMWGSTALGFGGIGGAAMTSDYTVAVTGPQHDVAVYFGGRFAYLIKRPNRTFYDDLGAQRMCESSSARKRYEATE